MNNKLDIGIVIIVFNRPEAALQLKRTLELVKPSNLFIISDGARTNKIGEGDLVRQCRNTFKKIDWECQVYRNYSDDNLGVRKRISSGINWVFTKVDKAIILEDDCIPSKEFFIFCSEMLVKYENDTRVNSVTGTNFFQDEIKVEESYFFSRYHSCWGWATWARAWRLYDAELSLFDDKKSTYRYLSSYLGSKREGKYWIKIVRKLKLKEVDSWAYIWSLSNYINHGLQIVPNINLVENIGFSSNATHTNIKPEYINNIKRIFSTDFRHPNSICFNEGYDYIRRNRVFSKNLYYKIKRGISILKSKIR